MWRKILFWRGENQMEQQAKQAIDTAEAMSRAKELYMNGYFTDDFDGRFASFCLFMAMVYAKNDENLQKNDFLQAIHNEIIRKLDDNLRLNGTSDMRIGKKVKEWAQKYFGRIAVYQQAYKTNDITLLQEAVMRNTPLNPTQSQELCTILLEKWDNMKNS